MIKLRIDQNPQLIEESDFGWWNTKNKLARWRCTPCGTKFNVGMTIHFIYTNSGEYKWNYGNFWTCHACFVKYPNLLKTMEHRLEVAHQYYWWYIPQEHNCND